MSPVASGARWCVSGHTGCAREKRVGAQHAQAPPGKRRLHAQSHLELTCWGHDPRPQAPVQPARECVARGARKLAAWGGQRGAAAIGGILGTREIKWFLQGL